MDTLARTTGAVCVGAGVAWVAAAVAHNLQPQGCIGDACEAGRQMRESSTLGLALFVVAGVLLAAGLVGLLLLARRTTRGGRTGPAAALASAAGLALLLSAGIVSTFVDPDWDGMPALVGPGLLLLVVGLVLLAVTLWRTQVLPNRLSLVVIATAALLPLANEQTSRILLAIPFGLALVTVGAHLIVRAGAPERPVGTHAGSLA